MRNKRCLKFAITASALFIVCVNMHGCPTCVGRLMLGVKKPFFEHYKPKPINRKKKSWKKKLRDMEKEKEQLKFLEIRGLYEKDK